MKNKVIERISVSEEILSVLPKNNQININNYIKEANKIYATYNKVLLQIEAEARQRNKIIADSIKDETINIKDTSAYPYQLKMINPITTPYEKTKIDKFLYYLNPEYECELIEINQYIIEIIKIFEKCGIKLTTNDFTYGESEKNFLSVLLDYENYDEDKAQEVFAKNYWSSPNIISNIQLNFKSLYYKNEKTFIKCNEEYKSKQNISFYDLLKTYRKTIIENELTLDTSSKQYLQKFLTKNLSINDYEDNNIKTLESKLFLGGQSVSLPTLNGLYNVLIEYKMYEKFAKIIKQVANDYQNLGKVKGLRAKKLKEILKLDRRLSKNDKNKLENLEKLKTLYQEYDELYYLEVLSNNLNPQSRISDVIYILVSFYKFYYQLNKKMNPEYSQEDLKSDYHVLYSFYINPRSNLINNLNMNTEENIAEIVASKYQLNNININEEDLEEKAIDNLIETVAILVNKLKIENLEKLDFPKIKDYYLRQELLNEIQRKSSQKE